VDLPSSVISASLPGGNEGVADNTAGVGIDTRTATVAGWALCSYSSVGAGTVVVTVTVPGLTLASTLPDTTDGVGMEVVTDTVAGLVDDPAPRAGRGMEVVTDTVVGVVPPDCDVSTMAMLDQGEIWLPF
jgi:hypothetical protein